MMLVVERKGVAPSEFKSLIYEEETPTSFSRVKRDHDRDNYSIHGHFYSYNHEDIHAPLEDQEESGIMDVHGLGEDHTLDYLHVMETVHDKEEHNLHLDNNADHQLDLQLSTTRKAEKSEKIPSFKIRTEKNIANPKSNVLEEIQRKRKRQEMMSASRDEEAYRLLPEYCDHIQRTNPGSIALVYKKDNLFHRLFLSYHASIYGFTNGCRPFISLDRVHLKSNYFGIMLIAVSFDAEGAMFPLAFAIVDEESDENWTWFLSELLALVKSNTPRLTFMSSRTKSIMVGLETNFPTAFHVFRQEYNNSLMKLLTDASHASTITEFEAKMAQINSLSPNTASWIKQIPLPLWVAAYYEGTRFGRYLEKSLHNLLHKALRLPPLQMLERIRWKVTSWFKMRRELSKKRTRSILVPSAELKVSCMEELINNFKVTPRENEEEIFDVNLPNGRSSVVDIRNRTCCCRGWQLDGLPCVHAAAAIRYFGGDVRKFVEHYYTFATYKKTYSQTIHRVPKMSRKRKRDEDNGK